MSKPPFGRVPGGAWRGRAGQPGRAAVSNRAALARLAPVQAVLPAGSGRLGAADFAAMSRTAFDTDWVRTRRNAERSMQDGSDAGE